MTKRMKDVDKNFAIAPQVEKYGFQFFNIDQEPFRIYGVFREEDRYRRMPKAVAQQVSSGVLTLHSNTAGGRVRFKTDSARVCIMATLDNIYKVPHCALTGISGFDMYEKTADGYRFRFEFVPPYDLNDYYECSCDMGSKEMRDLTINFPLYADVKELLVGIDEGAVLLPGDTYLPELPVVYYGSSITQGGCASRPGTCYQGHICRRFDRDYINLGFSGNALGEDAIIDYLQSLEMSMFVQDYDHNTPHAPYLAETGQKMFDAVRKAHPDIPIILMPRPKYYITEEEKDRRNAVWGIYQKALEQGDRNVYFIDNQQLMELAKDEGTVDGAHPTDLGFAAMAKAVGDLMAEIYAK